MDDFTFGLLYSVFGGAFIGGSLFLLARGVDRRRYLRPVLYGFFFGAGCSVLLIGGIFGYFLGGALTGYLLAREVDGWWNQFRAGALNGVFLVSSSILAIMYLSFTRNILEITKTEEALLLLYGDTVLYVLIWVAIVGVGAVLGGTMRKFLKPAEQRPATVEGSGYYRSEMVNLRRKTWG